MENCIVTENLSKRYQLGRLLTNDLRESIINWIKHPFQRTQKTESNVVWAVKDVSFQIKKGEVVGIIGRNGAGKSTLLKILSRITYPTSGKVDTRGLVASLLEVGTGFHGDLTGRENIYLNGSILGMRKKEIESKLDEIVAFAGAEKFLDTPVKRYSSGMFLRLGFAVAAHLEPDILLVDEVLAVGDAGFQRKCLHTMDELRSTGRTVLFVSHNMAAVENLCSRAIWIDNGQIRQDGNAKEVIGAYMASFSADSQMSFDLSLIKTRRGNGDIRFTRVDFLSSDGHPLKSIRSGEGLTVRLYYKAKDRITAPIFEVGVYTDLGTMITRFSTWIDYDITVLPPGKGYIDLAINCLNLLPGRFCFTLWLKSQGPVFYDVLEQCVPIDVEASDFYGSGKGMDRHFGIVFLPCKWQLNVLIDKRVETVRI